MTGGSHQDRVPRSAAKRFPPGTSEQHSAQLTPHSTRGPDLPGTVMLSPAFHGPPLANISPPQTNNCWES